MWGGVVVVVVAVGGGGGGDLVIILDDPRAKTPNIFFGSIWEHLGASDGIWDLQRCLGSKVTVLHTKRLTNLVFYNFASKCDDKAFFVLVFGKWRSTSNTN